MSTWLWVIIVVAIVVVAVLILSAAIRRRRYGAPARGLRARVRPHRRSRRRTARPPRPSCATARRVTTSWSCARSRRCPQGLHGRLAGDAGRVRRRSRRRHLRRRSPDPERHARPRLSRRGLRRPRRARLRRPPGRRRALPPGARDRRRERRRAKPTPKTCGSPCRTTARSSRSSSEVPPRADRPVRILPKPPLLGISTQRVALTL